MAWRATRDVAVDVADELRAAAARAEAAGIAPERIVLDPGFGFAKTPEQNFRLLDDLAAIVGLGYPVLVGPSRKRFLGRGHRPAGGRPRSRHGRRVRPRLGAGRPVCSACTMPASRARRSRVARA